MATDHIRYDLLVQDALRGVVSRVLAEVAREGLKGDHHFFISFRTGAPGVRLSSKMREQYPQEMMIVLQHQFWDLVVGEQAFEVGLSFHGDPETLVIPFTAVTGFFDPSVDFALKIESDAEAGEGEDVNEEAPVPIGERAAPRPGPTDKAKPPGSGSEPVEVGPSCANADEGAPVKLVHPEREANVVSIDQFRKKP